MPGHWRAGCSGNDELPGQISGVKFLDESQRYFLLELDDEMGDRYPMRYDAVSLYADEDDLSICNYNVLTHVIRNPTDYTARVCWAMVPRRLLNNHYNNTSDGENNGLPTPSSRRGECDNQPKHRRRNELQEEESK